MIILARLRHVVSYLLNKLVLFNLKLFFELRDFDFNPPVFT